MIDAIVFRPMEPADYRAFYNLMRETPGIVLRDADTPEAAARYLARNPGLSFVAVAGRRIVGGILAGHDGRRGYLHHLLVHRELRGQGIARILVDRAVTALGAAGIDKSHIDVLRDNQRGQGFWNALGWQRRDDIFRFSFINGSSANA